MRTYIKDDYLEAQDNLQDESLDLSQWIRLKKSIEELITTRHDDLYEESLSEISTEGSSTIWLKAIINDGLTKMDYEEYGLSEKTEILFYINPREFDPYNVHPIYLTAIEAPDIIVWKEKSYLVINVSKNKIFGGGLQPVFMIECIEEK